MSTTNPARRRVLCALRSCMPQLKVASLRPLRQGWDNYVYILNNSFTVKLSKSDTGKYKLLKEACLLGYLRAKLGGIVPEEVAKCGSNACSFENALLVYKFIPGETLAQRGLLSIGSDHAACRILARTLQSVHAMSPPVECAELIPNHDTSQKWANFIVSEVWRLVDMAGSAITPLLREALLKRVKEYTEYLQRCGFTSKLIHGDIDPRNIVVASNGRIAGLIDWGEAAVGDPAIDYAGLFYVDGHVGNHVLSLQCEEHIQTLLPRVEFHRDIAPLYWVAYGVQQENTRLIKKGLAHLTLWLKDYK
ncbi:MAG: aminoglycoside phosphotransferase family protein [Thermoprotei archaeon]